MKLDYDLVPYARTRKVKVRSKGSNNDKQITSVRIEIDSLVLEGFSKNEIDNETLAASIIANLSQLIQNNTNNNFFDVVSETAVNKEEIPNEITLSADNALEDRSIIHLASVDAGSFQLSSESMNNNKNINNNSSAHIGQNVSKSVFYGLLNLRSAIKQS